MDYIQINLDISPKHPWTELITQELAEINFDSFTEENKVLQAFINAELFDEKSFQQLIQSYSDRAVKIQIEKKFIPYQNWNALWESDYQPVVIGKQLMIRAPFHQADDSFELSIEIQPQMSFGTGHHQTTFLLSQALLKLELKGASVLDVGTGTGVLGILAAQLGADKIVGTDIEEGAVENAIENCKRNQISNFSILKGDIEIVPNDQYDIILANINRNVLLKHLPSYADLIKPRGLLLLSGFFETDVETLTDAAQLNGFAPLEILTKEKWAVLKLVKTI